VYRRRPACARVQHCGHRPGPRCLDIDKKEAEALLGYGIGRLAQQLILFKCRRGERYDMRRAKAGLVSRTHPLQRPAIDMSKTSAVVHAKHAPRKSAVSPAERKVAGKGLRDTVPRNAHAAWQASVQRADPIGILRAADVVRQPHLVPLRYGRMLQSPFTFYRGSAGVMAADLARTPTTGIHVQTCGDCHLLNFGGFATPERRLIFDINDLDETLPGPWEWDVKRLVASFVLAARANGLSDETGRDAAVACACSYRQAMHDFADMNVLDVWYARLDDTDVLSMLPQDRKAILKKRIAKATAASSSELLFPKLIESAGHEPRIHDSPPIVFHADASQAAGNMDMIKHVLARYRETLAEDRRVLFDRYRLVDAAVKVVGIGSVGTLCMVLLMMSMAENPLFLQVKQANASVLEPYVGKSAFAHHGQRVVMGQRLMQPASDLFLGWATGPENQHFYARQLRDVKLSPLVETFDAAMLAIYGTICGWVLARAHAKAGDPWALAGYLGNSDQFEHAMGQFALLYADQAELDHATLRAAVKAGTIDVELER